MFRTVFVVSSPRFQDVSRNAKRCGNRFVTAFGAFRTIRMTRPKLNTSLATQIGKLP
jgi:hypothetical protein